MQPSFIPNTASYQANRTLLKLTGSENKRFGHQIHDNAVIPSRTDLWNDGLALLAAIR